MPGSLLAASKGHGDPFIGKDQDASPLCTSSGHDSQTPELLRPWMAASPIPWYCFTSLKLGPSIWNAMGPRKGLYPRASWGAPWKAIREFCFSQATDLQEMGSLPGGSDAISVPQADSALGSLVSLPKMWLPKSSHRTCLSTDMHKYNKTKVLKGRSWHTQVSQTMSRQFSTGPQEASVSHPMGRPGLSSIPPAVAHHTAGRASSCSTMVANGLSQQ